MGARGQGPLAPGIRAYPRRGRIAVTVPKRRDQQANRHRHGRSGGRLPVSESVIYRRRNVVECCFNRLKQFWTIATCHDKIALSCRAMIELFILLI
ncbi:hypothetical protein GCM10010452_00500 [Crossiella cryophila]